MKMQDLKERLVWINWRAEERDGNKTKVPYNPRTGGGAQSNNPETWADFSFAQNKQREKKYDGIGFMFADEICGIDIDNKKKDPALERQAQTVIALMDTYTERSPSGTGYHLIFKCDISKLPTANGKLDAKYYYKNPHNDLECYFSGLTNRYFTYTGEVVSNKDIEERTEQVLIFLENYMLKDNFKKPPAQPLPNPKNGGSVPLGASIPDRARRAKNGIKFSALYDRGDTSEHNGDDSAADQALCNMLAWWLQGDFNTIDSYFRLSALYREKWERADYRISTINKAIESCGGQYYKGPGRPKNKRQAAVGNKSETENDSAQKFITIEGTDEYLKQIGISVRYNQITRDTDIQGNIDNYDPEHIKNNLLTDVYDQLKLIYKKCPKRDFIDHIAFISSRNRFNPVLELISKNKWDGTDRLPELHAILNIIPSDGLSQALILKWYWQNLSMARNERGEYGADGLLVLQGTQGIGKTTLARKSALKDEFFGEGLQVDIKNKDTVIEATSCWIGELGEIESTFKSDINALKAFITRTKDTYRMPYAADFDKLSRRTSFIGTCNSEKFLVDETGNRRFWTVPVLEIDRQALNNFDFLQLYLQIDQEYASGNIQGFRLTENEQRQLAERNSRHEKFIRSEDEVRDILFKAERDNLPFEEMTVTEFKELYPVLRNYPSNQISAALNKLGVITESKWKEGKTRRLASLPRPKFRLNIEDFN